MSQPSLVCFGELLWDMLPSGKVAGGAPFNITNRATALGLDATVISSVGSDDLGDELVALVAQKGNNTSFIQRHKSLPTSVVNIEVGERGEPHYNIVHPVAWDDIVITDKEIELVRNADAFIYSSLGLRDERAREALFTLLPHAKLKICDVNLRDGHYTKETILRMLDHADILRMNETELTMVADWLGLEDDPLELQIKKIYHNSNYKLVIATLGGDGAMLYDGTTVYEQPVFQVEVKDTVGAGDAFLAALTFQLLSGVTFDKALRYATVVGSITASKDGGTPEISQLEIEEMLATQ